MIAAGEAAGKKLMIAYRCHFEPVNLKATNMVRTGMIGAVQRLETANNYRVGNDTPATNWRLARALAGGGPLEDYGLYGLQAAMYLTGETPVRLSAVTEQPSGDPRFSEVFSTVRAQLYFPSGAIAHLETSYDSDPDNMSNVYGTEGSILMRPANGYSGNRITLVKGEVSGPVEAGTSDIQFARMCQHFAYVVRKDMPVRTPGAMGLRDLKLIEAIYRSAVLGTPVDV
jgi:predicted dehydrogenase